MEMQEDDDKVGQHLRSRRGSQRFGDVIMLAKQGSMARSRQGKAKQGSSLAGAKGKWGMLRNATKDYEKKMEEVVDLFSSSRDYEFRPSSFAVEKAKPTTFRGTTDKVVKGMHLFTEV